MWAPKNSTRKIKLFTTSTIFNWLYTFKALRLISRSWPENFPETLQGLHLCVIHKEEKSFRQLLRKHHQIVYNTKPRKIERVCKITHNYCAIISSSILISKSFNFSCADPKDISLKLSPWNRKKNELNFLFHPLKLTSLTEKCGRKGKFSITKYIWKGMEAWSEGKWFFPSEMRRSEPHNTDTWHHWYWFIAKIHLSLRCLSFSTSQRRTCNVMMKMVEKFDVSELAE